MAPESYADHDIRLEPAIIPFLFLGRFEMHRVNVYPDLAQAPVQELTLRGEPRCRWRILSQY